MILTKEELADLERDIDLLSAKLTELRKPKIAHNVLSYIKENFGDVELGSSILVYKDGKRYVLAKLEEQVNINFAQNNYYKYCSIVMYAIEQNGTLTKKYTYMHSPLGLTVTGDRL